VTLETKETMMFLEFGFKMLDVCFVLTVFNFGKQYPFGIQRFLERNMQGRDFLSLSSSYTKWILLIGEL
jgi:hypothetical protein